MHREINTTLSDIQTKSNFFLNVNPGGTLSYHYESKNDAYPNPNIRH